MFIKDRREGADNGLQIFSAQVDLVDPLADDPVICQAIAADLKEFRGEEIADPGDPGIGGYRGDDIVGLGGELQVVAAVSNHVAHLRMVVEGSSIGFFKILFSRLDNFFRDFQVVDQPYGVGGQGAQRDPASKAEGENALWVRVQDHREMSRHHLVGKILGVASIRFDGSIGLAGDSQRCCPQQAMFDDGYLGMKSNLMGQDLIGPDGLVDQLLDGQDNIVSAVLVVGA